MWTSWKFWTVWVLILGFIALMGFGFTTDPKKVPSPLIGKEAPDFEVTSLEGVKKIKLSELRGTPVLLNFWASWCQECRAEAHILESFHQKYGKNNAKVKVIGIAIQDSPEQAKLFAKTFGKTYFLALDDKEGNIALDYGIYGVPESYLINPKGKILFKQVGSVTMTMLEKYFKPFL